MKQNKKDKASKSNPHMPSCVFCGRNVHDGVDIVVGPNGVGLCVQCAKHVAYVSGDNDIDFQSVSKNRQSDSPKSPIMTPREIVNRLNDYVVGQEDVKKTLATAVYNHYSRLHSLNTEEESNELKDVQVEKSNILLVGPTGCGKTL